ncbi:MAG: hypothetical protein R2809_08345 [Flavobacteriales bacterium]
MQLIALFLYSLFIGPSMGVSPQVSAVNEISIEIDGNVSDSFSNLILFADELRQSEQKENSQFENEETQEDDDCSSYTATEDFKTKEKNIWESISELQCFKSSKRPFFFYKSWKLDVI